MGEAIPKGKQEGVVLSSSISQLQKIGSIGSVEFHSSRLSGAKIRGTDSMFGQKISKALKEDLWPELLLWLATSGNSDIPHKGT